MKAVQVLQVLAELTSYQWGMVTSAQASMRGVKRLDLSRLAESGHLRRISHGVYMDAGSPETEFDDLRAAWLSTDPEQPVYERLNSRADGVVVAGESAARLHRIGDFRAVTKDFVSPTRRQSQRMGIRYRQRALDPRDITVVEGMPVMTIERTIADLVEDRHDLSLVADALRDAAASRILDLDRLGELLTPLAARNGLRKGDGHGLLGRLQDVAGIDVDSLAKRVANTPNFGALVAADYLRGLTRNDLAGMVMTPELEGTMRSIQKELTDQLRVSLAPQLESMNSDFAAIAKDAQFTESIRKVSEQLITGDFVQALSLSWIKPVAEHFAASAEIQRSVQIAQHATARTVSNG